MKTITTSIAALLLLTGCDNAQTSAPQRPLPEVGIVTLMSQPVSVVSELTGRTAAAMSAEVRPQVGGIIQKRLFTEGDTVKAGQALYQIDPSRPGRRCIRSILPATAPRMMKPPPH